MAPSPFLWSPITIPQIILSVALNQLSGPHGEEGKESWVWDIDFLSSDTSLAQSMEDKANDLGPQGGTWARR